MCTFSITWIISIHKSQISIFYFVSYIWNCLIWQICIYSYMTVREKETVEKYYWIIINSFNYWIMINTIWFIAAEKERKDFFNRFSVKHFKCNQFGHYLDKKIVFPSFYFQWIVCFSYCSLFGVMIFKRQNSVNLSSWKKSTLRYLRKNAKNKISFLTLNHTTPTWIAWEIMVFHSPVIFFWKHKWHKIIILRNHHFSTSLFLHLY